jgi:hypothetical protein
VAADFERPLTTLGRLIGWKPYKRKTFAAKQRALLSVTKKEVRERRLPTFLSIRFAERFL